MCAIHGGSTPRGLALPQTKHGLYSKSLPVRLASRFDEALDDAELLSTRRDAALVATFIDEQLAKLDTGETGAHWARLREAWDEYGRAGEKDKAHRLAWVGRLIEDGAREAEAVREIRSALLDRARLAESERKRLVEAHEVVTMDRLGLLMGAVSAAILAEVRDREQCSRILAALERLLRQGDGGDARGVPAQLRA